MIIRHKRLQMFLFEIYCFKVNIWYISVGKLNNGICAFKNKVKKRKPVQKWFNVS